MPTSSIRDTIRRLTEDFARQLIAALQAATIEEVLSTDLTSVGSAARESRRTEILASRAKATKPSGRRTRAPRNLESLLERAVALLERHGKGLRAERLRAELGVSGYEARQIVSLGIARKRVSKQGAKRGTTYFATSSGTKPAPKRTTPVPAEPIASKPPTAKAKPKSRRAKGGGTLSDAAAASKPVPSPTSDDTMASKKATRSTARRGAHVVVSDSGKAAGFKTEG